MGDDTDGRARRAEEIGLFRYGLISDLIRPEGGEASITLYQRLREKAGRSYCIPGSRRTRVAEETMRDWIKLYKEGGFDALKPKARKDIGSARAIPQAVIDALIDCKDQHRDHSVSMVIDEVKKTNDQARITPLPLSTVHRVLSRAGVMVRNPECPTTKDRRHFTFARAGELWMSDVMHGPSVVASGRRKQKAYLICVLDDATRVIPFAAFALSEGTVAFLLVLRQAVMRRGIPLRLYVDNGSAFRSHHLALVCARLGITLIHARPYQPAGKGKQERFFRTVRMRFLPTLGPDDLGSLDALNRRFWAWVEGEYHRAPHRGLDGTTPLDAWAMRAGDVRTPGPELDLREMFLFEQKRKVHKDRTLSLDGVGYEVDATLVGEMVTVRFDPAKKGAPVDIWHGGRKVQTARVVDAYANCFVKRNNETRALHVIDVDTSPAAPAPGLRLRDLDKDDEEKH
jgi:transposase InsO family protein